MSSISTKGTGGEDVPGSRTTTPPRCLVSGALAGAGGGTGGRRAVPPARSRIPAARQCSAVPILRWRTSRSPPFSTSPTAGGLPGDGWRWEKGGEDGLGRTSPFNGPTDMYSPTAADVGYRLRASVNYEDGLGNRVRAVTEPSETRTGGLRSGPHHSFRIRCVPQRKQADLREPELQMGRRIRHAVPVGRLFAGFREWNARTRCAEFRMERVCLAERRRLRHRAPVSGQRSGRHPNRTG